MIRVGVDCRFSVDGTINVRQIFLNGRWQRVQQGRQWADRSGRHVLIMLPGEEPGEIVLRPETMTWELGPAGNRGSRLV